MSPTVKPVAQRSERERLDELIDWYHAHQPGKHHNIHLRMTPSRMWSLLGLVLPEGGVYPNTVQYRGHTITALGKPDPGLPGRV